MGRLDRRQSVGMDPRRRFSDHDGVVCLSMRVEDCGSFAKGATACRRAGDVV